MKPNLETFSLHYYLTMCDIVSVNCIITQKMTKVESQRSVTPRTFLPQLSQQANISVGFLNVKVKFIFRQTL